MAAMKKKATPKVGSSKADRAFSAKTGVGKTAQASRGMNIFAKENIPKGYTVQKVTLSSGKNVAVVGRTTNPGVAKTVRSQQSGYRNPVGVSKTITAQPSGYNNPKASTNRSVKKNAQARRKRGM